MTKDVMTIGEFTDYVDRFGPDLGRWPAPMRDAAARLAESDIAAARLQAEAERVETAVATLATPRPLEAPHVSRLVKALADRRSRYGGDVLVSLRRPRAAFALTLVAGLCFALGVVAGGDMDALSDDTSVAALVGGDTTLLGDI
jgi:hypothetical protein